MDKSQLGAGKGIYSYFLQGCLMMVGSVSQVAYPMRIRTKSGSAGPDC